MGLGGGQVVGGPWILGQIQFEDVVDLVFATAKGVNDSLCHRAMEEPMHGDMVTEGAEMANGLGEGRAKN